MLLNIGSLPDVTGANHENHLMRTSRVVKHVVYGKDTVSYSTFDSPADSVDVLRLAYAPTSIRLAANLCPSARTWLRMALP